MPSLFNNVVSWFANDGVTADELQRESDRLDAAKKEQDRRTAQRIADELGTDAAAEWERQVNENQVRDGSTYGLNVEQQLDQAFDEGLNEGSANVTGTIRGGFGIVGKALSSVLAGIPIWIWLIALGTLFFYVGGPAWAAKKLKQR